jgi:hypothetical protein
MPNRRCTHFGLTALRWIRRTNLEINTNKSTAEAILVDAIFLAETCPIWT